MLETVMEIAILLRKLSEFAGYISVSGGGDINVTDAMNWINLTGLPFKLAAPFSFTATEWANEMSANGMGLILIRCKSGYWVPYSAFADVTTAAVVTNTQQKISLADLSYKTQ